MLKFIKNNLPIIGLFTLVLLIALVNYRQNTFLIGWDNLLPELNFWVNIKRSIFAVWQEYQGLGLLGGMGHAADLVHQIILLSLSLILPISILRYFWVFLMLFIGAVGVYFLLEKIILKQDEEENINNKITSFLGACFYILNLSTLQTFYTPFETFVAHFGFLPWLLFSIFYYIKKPSKKRLLLYGIIAFLATTQAYVPTLFVVYMLTLSIIFFVLLIIKFNKLSLFQFIKIIIVTLFINAFWLLPFLHFTFTNSQVLINAKINQMETDTVYSQNKEFGDIFSSMLLKGFWFNNVNPNMQGSFVYMMEPWKTYLNYLPIQIIGYLFFAIILIGFISALKSKKGIFIAFAVLFFFSFTMLTTTTWLFSWINYLFRKIPLFYEAFRFPFTKFSILAGFSYAIMFAVGINTLINILRNRKNYIYLFNIIVFFLLIIFTLPMSQGHLFYEKERLVLPKEYFQLFDFFKHQDPNTRIANFPQYTFWGWNFYNWGYGGSGFLWYGIKQPILDRAFDVWSSNNENYYWEISKAIYLQDPKLFVSILQKYQVTWLVVDKNVFSPDNPKIINNSGLEILIKKTLLVKKQTSFGKIDVYELNLSNKMQDFVSVQNNLPSSNNYSWGNNDQMYLDHQNYLTGKKDVNYFYPFRSLFSNRTQNDLEFKMTEDSDSIIFSSIMPQNLNGKEFFLSAYLQKEIILPATIFAQKEDDNSLTVSADIVSPEIWIDSKKVWEIKKTEILFKLSKDTIYPLKLNINGIDDFVIDGNSQIIGKTFLTAKQDNVFVLSNNKTQTISANYLQSLNLFSESTAIYLPEIRKNSVLVVKFPKLTSDYINFLINFQKLKTNINNCDNFRKGITKSTLNNNGLDFYSKNATSCIAYYDGNLSHEIGYGVFVKTKNIQGKSFHFWVENNSNGFSIIDTYLPENKINNTSTFILNPMENSGTGYSMHFDNISIGQEVTQNEFSSLALYAIPYNFLTSLVFQDNHSAALSVKSNFSVSHPNESLYIVNNLISDSKPQTLILSQSFNKGWKMYQITNLNWFTTAFPFCFGKEIKDHVLVNNWENGWIIPASSDQRLASSYVIVFLPQYLEYVGFLLLGVTFLWIIFR